MTVEGEPRPVVAHRGSGVGVAGSVLDISKGYPGVERGGDEAVPQAAGADLLDDPCTSGDSFHGSVGGVAIHSLAVGAQEDRPGRTFSDVEPDGSPGSRCERDDGALSAGRFPSWRWLSVYALSLLQSKQLCSCYLRCYRVLGKVCRSRTVVRLFTSGGR